MSFGFLGIQFGFALQNANTSRIFETLGADVEQIPILWIAAPLTGLLVQPVVGYFSDRTWHPKLGRRRPYFLVGAILASISLCLMPNSPTLWVAAGMLWIMDASINISMEPFRAFVGDNLPAEQRTMGFAMQSFFIGTGAVIASMLPWMLNNWFGVANTAGEGQISDAVKWSYYLGAIVFLLAVLWTILRSHEYPPEQLKQFADTGEEEIPIEELTPEQYSSRSKNLRQAGAIAGGVGLLGMLALVRADLEKELYVLAGLLLIVGILWIAASALMKQGRYQNGFVTIMSDLLRMPKTMQQLAVVQFFSWFALFSMWIYTTSAVTKHIYGTYDTTSLAYNEGADWVGFLFAVYNGIAAIIAFGLPYLAKRTSRRFTHMICLVLGGIGLIAIYFVSDPMLLLIPMLGVGIAWASILSMPYAMLAGALPADKMGYYMGVFNFFIVIPQIVAATILGLIVGRFFNDEAVFALIVGGACMILAGLLSLRVDDDE
jgi:maltose/moltooligosaccharide transporter